MANDKTALGLAIPEASAERCFKQQKWEIGKGLEHAIKKDLGLK